MAKHFFEAAKVGTSVEVVEPGVKVKPVDGCGRCAPRRLPLGFAAWIGRRTWKSEISGNKLAFDEPTRRVHGGHKWFAEHDPRTAGSAESTEYAKPYQRSSRRSMKSLLRLAAQATAMSAAVCRCSGGVSLSFERMNRMMEINFADGVAMVEPGVITGEFQAAVARAELFYPPDPASLRTARLAGMSPRTRAARVACNMALPAITSSDSRSRSRMATVCAQVGGPQNKSGFDLVGLFVGAEGRSVSLPRSRCAFSRCRRARAMSSGSFATLAETAAAVQAYFRGGISTLGARDRGSVHTRGRAARPGPAGMPEGDAHLLVEIDGQEETERSTLRALAQLLLCDILPSPSRRPRRPAKISGPCAASSAPR